MHGSWREKLRLLTPAVLAFVLLASGAPGSRVLAAPMPRGAGLVTLDAIPAADDTSDRQSFTSKAQAEVQEWQRKVSAAAQSADASGRRDVNTAWTRTKDAAHRLQTASADGWDRAKIDFEKAKQNLEATWHKVYPGEK